MRNAIIILVLVLIVGVAAVVFSTRCGSGDGSLEAVWSTIHNMFTGEGAPGVMEDNENVVLEALVDYAKAQSNYAKENGFYASKLDMLELTPGMSAAQLDVLGSTAFRGYKFIHVTKDGNRIMPFRDEFLLTAAPAMYKVTGVNTFAIGHWGEIYYKDNSGAPLMNAEELDDGSWQTQ
jgi:hypothetical protein